jgi:hypothetical protein
MVVSKRQIYIYISASDKLSTKVQRLHQCFRGLALHGDLGDTICGERSRSSKLVNMEQTVTVGASVIQPAAVDFKLCTMMHSIHTGQCPTFSSDMVRAVAIHQMRSGLRSTDTAQ